MTEKSYLDVLGGIVLIASRELVIEYCSAPSESIVGYTPDRICSTPDFWINHVHPDHQLVFRNALQSECREGKIETVDFLFQIAGGEYRWLQSRVSKFKNEQGDSRLSIFIADIHEQRMAALLEEEDRALNTELLKHLSHVFFLFTQDGQFIRWNNRLVEVSGYADDEIEAMRPMDFFPPEARPYVKGMIEAVLQNGRVEMDSLFMAKDGTTKHVHFIGSRFMYKGELCVSGVAIDVSAQKNAENALRRSEQRFRALVQEGSDMIAILDEVGNYLYVSSNYKSLVGYTPEYLIGKNGFDFFHPDDLELILSEFLSLKSQKRITSSPYRFRRNDGTWCWMRSTGTNMYDDDSIHGIIVNSVDITKLIETQQALNVSNSRFEKVMKASSESIWELDVLKGELFLGDGFTRIFDIEVKETSVNNSWFNQHIHPDDREKVISSFRQALADTQLNHWQFKYRIINAAGQEYRVRDKATIERGASGRAINVVGVMKDVTEVYFQEKLDKLEFDVLQQTAHIAKEEKEILSNYLRGLEKLIPGMRTSILKVEDGRLFPYISPHLHVDFLNYINGVPVGLTSGSCGAAAFLNKNIFCSNINESPYWEGHCDMASRHKIVACWSEPITNHRNEVIATLAHYFNYAKYPTEVEIHTIQRSQILISLVLSKFQYLTRLNQSIELYENVNKVTNDAIYDWDILNDSFTWGEGFYRLYGYEATKKFSLTDKRNMEFPQDVDYYRTSWNEFLLAKNRYKWHAEVRIRHQNGHYLYSEELGHVIRDSEGNPIRMIGVLRDISKRKEQELNKEIHQEISELFSQELSLEAVLKKVSDYLRIKFSMPIVELWLTSNEGALTYKVADSIRKDLRASYKAGDEIDQFEFGNGLPGSIWQYGCIQIWKENDLKSDFQRKKLLENVGLVAGFGIPLLGKKAHVGQLLLLSQEDLNERTDVLSVLDVLSQKLGEEIARKKQEIEMRLLFDSAPDILGVAGPNGKFVKVNPAFCDLLGYTEEEITSRPFNEFLHPNDRDASISEYEMTISGSRKVKNFVNRYKTKSGEFKWISWSGSDHFGIDNYVFSYGRDVTQMLELQNMLDDATDLSKIGAWEYNLENKQYYWSPMMREIHGVTSEYEINEKTAFDFFRDDFKGLAAEKFERCINSFEPFDFEVIIITHSGEERWVRVMGRAEMLEGRCVRVYGSSQDIHANKEVELRLKNVSDNIPGVMFQYVYNVKTKEENLRYVSNGSKSIWGYEPDECIRNRREIWKGIKLGGDFELLQSTVLESIKDQSPWHARWRYILPDGRARYHEAFGNPNKISASEIVWDTIIMDVTDLKEYEELARRTAQVAKIGSWEIDLTSTTEPRRLFCSPTLCSILEEKEGYLPTIIEGLRFFRSDDFKHLKVHLEELIKHQKVFDLQFEIRLRNNTKKWIRCIGRVDQVNGRSVKLYGSVQDIQDQKQIEFELMKLNSDLEKNMRDLQLSNKELEQFAFVASHDLQEPLRMVTSFLSLLDKKYSDQLDDKAKSYINYAVQGGERMRAIILDLLEFSRAGVAEDAVLASVDLNMVLVDVQILLKKQIEDAQASLFIANLPLVQGDHSRLRQVFQNLISNAIKYRAEARPLKISLDLEVTDKEYLISVTDNGMGIEKKYHQKIFELFQRLHAKGQYSGNGIGLSITKKIVESLGGEIQLESTFGEGSSFTIRLKRPPER